MNVKIAKNAVTFKISEEEMNNLLEGRLLESTTPIGGVLFTTCIDPERNNGDKGSTSLKLLFEQKKTKLTLYASERQIQKLSDIGKSREGITTEIEGIKVSLQVNIRADSRPRQKN